MVVVVVVGRLDLTVGDTESRQVEEEELSPPPPPPEELPWLK